uniref:Eukaryotic translation initiation factor 3 subunit E n=1 Tax=Lepeophtheirus salmonis TaxID=72036 RepID=D3PK64_LEPSM|nr:Eukaryotic translation initiation factor 3 subunit E [Lepeophtheirus salmonis]
MAEWDLTSKISKCLDSHLIYPILQFLSAKKIHKSDNLCQWELQLAQSTRMTGYELEIVEKMGNEVSDDLKQKDLEYKALIRQKEQEFMPHLNHYNNFHNSDLDLPGQKKVLIEKSFEYATLMYDASEYQNSISVLRIVETLLTKKHDKYLACKWGLLACSILLQDELRAMQDLVELKTAIDEQTEENGNSRSFLEQLQQRTWMLHWSLHVFFRLQHTGRNQLVEWFLNTPNHLNAIQTLAPHLLRYLSVCVVVSKESSMNNNLRHLIHLIQQESYSYQDPITRFLKAVYVDFDFEVAEKELLLCRSVLENDFFTTTCVDEFMEVARQLMLEIFCKIFNCVDLDSLAKSLHMNPEAAEKWIVSMIKAGKIDAKIDSENNEILMQTQSVSPYRQVIERTRDKTHAASRLASKLNKELTIES